MTTITTTLTKIASAANLGPSALDALADIQSRAESPAQHVALALDWLDARRADVVRREIGSRDLFGDAYTVAQQDADVRAIDGAAQDIRRLALDLGVPVPALDL